MQPTEPQRILVIEDDAHIAEGLRLNLVLQHHAVEIAPDGVRGLAAWRAWRPDLIILDIMLPGIDGLSVLQNIRLEDERIPILILSAKATPADRIAGFTLGVDDYLTKPFTLEEFLLRVERLLRRLSWSREADRAGLTESSQPPASFSFGGNRIDFVRATALCKAGSVKLTEQEVKLLKLFVLHRGKPLSREKLLEIGWGYSRTTTTRTVDNFMVRLRRYFEADPKRPVHFRSLRSIGYLFDPDQ